MERIFTPADILLPAACPERWSVIACDQFTSEPAYWQRVREQASRPSALDMILPEAWLDRMDPASAGASLRRAMAAYLTGGEYRAVTDSFVYVERTLPDGRLRRGLVGKLDLEAYDYRPGTQAPVQASEATVPARIGPRQQLRRGAPLELPHAMVLLNDPERTVTEPLSDVRDSLELLYDFPLMEGGGSVRGYRVAGRDAVRVLAALDALDAPFPPMAVGDGNHSLAAAKACWEERKAAGAPADDPCRYALTELNNIYDEGIGFLPIHRTVSGTDPAALEKAMARRFSGEEGWPVDGLWARGSFTLRVPAETYGSLISVFQAALEACCRQLGGSIDYIHGDDSAAALGRRDGCISFFLPSAEKGELFGTIRRDGRFPAKSFSIGEAREKRYYLEARRLTP